MRMVLLADIVALVFVVFVIVFAASAESSDVRTLPKWVWILLCVFFPVLGGIAYLIWGRPISGQAGLGSDNSRGSNGRTNRDGSERTSFMSGLKTWLGYYDADDDDRPNIQPEFKYRQEPAGRKGQVAPDDDPEFLRELARKLQQQKDAEKFQAAEGAGADDELGDQPADKSEGGDTGDDIGGGSGDDKPGAKP